MSSSHSRRDVELVARSIDPPDHPGISSDYHAAPSTQLRAAAIMLRDLEAERTAHAERLEWLSRMLLDTCVRVPKPEEVRALDDDDWIAEIDRAMRGEAAE